MELKTHITKKLIKIDYQVNELNVATHKRCSRCKAMILLELYSINGSCFLGKHNWCKFCAKTRVKQHRDKEITVPCKSPLVLIGKQGEKDRRCSKCGFIKSLNTEFDLARSGFMGHDSECRECKRRRGELSRRDKGIKQKRVVPVLVDANGVTTHRECARCIVMHPLAQYNKHKGAFLGLHPYCKECTAERWLISKYGITMSDKKSMYEAQSCCCAICKVQKPLEALMVDHCHATGNIRGLLCDPCNMGLGFFEDKVCHIKHAVTYLESFTDVADRHTK